MCYWSKQLKMYKSYKNIPCNNTLFLKISSWWLIPEKKKWLMNVYKRIKSILSICLYNKHGGYCLISVSKDVLKVPYN